MIGKRKKSLELSEREKDQQLQVLDLSSVPDLKVSFFLYYSS